METWMTVIGGTLADKGHALVFGPGRNPINFVSVRDVAALVALPLATGAMPDETVEIGGPGEPGLRHRGRAPHRGPWQARPRSNTSRCRSARDVGPRPPVLPDVRAASAAAVVMNTTDMTFDAKVRDRFPSLPATTLKDLL